MPASLPNSETDTGPTKLAPGTERLCVATRVVKPVADMIRFVVGPDGAVVPDLKRRLPGRGVWITASRAAVAEAIKRKAFARGFRQEVRLETDLVDFLEKLLERAALDALAIAHKAKLVAAGFAKVEATLAGEPVVALLHAVGAGADGVRKIAATARRRFGEDADRLMVIDAFTSMQLDLALGRSNVIHAALLAGSASDGFLARYRSLEGFRTVDPSGPG